MNLSGKPVILVVDDLEQNVSYIEAILKPLDVLLIKAYSGKEALERIRNHELALALIDVQMPRMTGLELAAAILAGNNRELFPIIFVTAYPLKGDDLVSAYKSGITDFIAKPFDKYILLSKIKIFLELHRQKKQLAESERMYKLLLNASPEGIVIMDTKGTIREISNVALAVLGVNSPSDLAGKQIYSLFPEEEHQQLREIVEKALNGELTQNIEFRAVRGGNGEQFMSEISLTRISDSHGIHAALMAIIRDISERKRMEQQQIQTDRMASLGEMATGIAHEINQPLNNISFGLDNLLAEINRECEVNIDYFQTKSQKIFDNIARIAYIIDHIRTFSKGQDDFIPTYFSVNESIHNGVTLITEQLKHRGIDMALNLAEEIDPILGNSYKFEQVILNLLHNAKDALEEKGRVIQEKFIKFIGIKTFQVEKTIFVEVTDNGIGMTPESKDRALFPFYTTKGTGKGTGLGLSISLGIIKELQGTIEVESEYSKGTTIRLVIPI